MQGRNSQVRLALSSFEPAAKWPNVACQRECAESPNWNIGTAVICILLENRRWNKYSNIIPPAPGIPETRLHICFSFCSLHRQSRTKIRSLTAAEIGPIVYPGTELERRIPKDWSYCSKHNLDEPLSRKRSGRLWLLRNAIRMLRDRNHWYRLHNGLNTIARLGLHCKTVE